MPLDQSLESHYGSLNKKDAQPLRVWGPLGIHMELSFPAPNAHRITAGAGDKGGHRTGQNSASPLRPGVLPH